VGVLVLQEGVSLGFESIRGIYRSDPDDIYPGRVSVADESTVVENIDIVIDFSGPEQRQIKRTGSAANI
jgi:hypothetical protein